MISKRAALRAITSLLAVALSGCARLFFPLPPLSPRAGELPRRMSEAGLYTDASLTVVAAGVRPYAPRFELWSDGASKRRWIRLPPGSQIDTSDMDDWEFPVGTELWKEFSRGGVRVETRLLVKLSAGEDGWVGAAYAWNAAQTDASLTLDGVDDALETGHDVPGARACMTCHGGRRHRALGFAAVQLAHPAASPGDLTLDGLVASGLLTAPPRAPVVVPGTAQEALALGYLHVNCGSCHNSNRPRGARFFAPGGGLDLWLRAVTPGGPCATPAYRTAIPRYVVPGKPAESELLRRVANPTWFWERMPPFATKEVDASGVRALSTWVGDLRPGSRERGPCM